MKLSKPSPLMIRCAVVGLVVGGIAGAARGALAHRFDSATVLTAILVVVITGYYALQCQQTVAEMRRQREDADGLRKEERSRAAAWRALKALEGAADHPVVGPMALDKESAGLAWPRLKRELPFIVEDDVRERTAICAEVMRVSSTFPAHEFAPGDCGYAIVLMRVVASVEQWTLEAYIAEGPLPPWPDDFPQRSVSALAWLIDSVKRGRQVVPAEPDSTDGS